MTWGEENFAEDQLTQALTKEHTSKVEEVVSWYFKSLPEVYFRRVGAQTRKEHVKALVALKGIDSGSQGSLQLTLNSKSEYNGLSDVTQLSTESKPGVLSRMFEEIASGKGGTGFLHRAQAFSSLDDTATLNIFTYGATREINTATDGDMESALERVAEFQAPGLDPAFATREAMQNLFRLCPPWYARSVDPVKYARHWPLYEKVRGTEDTEAVVGDPEERGVWISIAAANASPKILLAKLTRLLFHRGLDVRRLTFDMFSDPSTSVGSLTGRVCMVRILVSAAEADGLPEGTEPFAGSAAELSSEAWRDLLADIRRVRFLDESTINLGLKTCPWLGLQRAEILDTFCAMLHGPLNKLNPHAYTRTNMLAAISKTAPQCASDIADLFLARFNPASPLAEEAFRERLASLRERSISSVSDESARTLMLKMLDVVEHTLRTNLYFPSRYGLALRVAPSVMVSPEKVQPFGVFFVHGDCFDGFHNRFQNIARGGLRLVTPPSHEQCLAESSRIYDEVYDLSSAQEMKNKDIPEGGSKAVVLVDVFRAGDRHAAMRTSLKFFVNSILDLIVTTGPTKGFLVDHLGVDEPIFLGPDEQVIPEDIDWIIKQAGRRGYSVPAAFMSSKPKAGINHKTYGVTSEGVSVFLDVALRDSGIEPDKQPFTIKITGGPDGDVGGNLMRILIRDYGSNMRCVGIADGSGCVEDPKGLSHSELLRLFQAALPICDIDPKSLSPQGVVHKASTEEGATMRNTMHNRLKADVFVPAGGRPNTIHEGNWQLFLDPTTGKPSSPLIVEGANMFITPEARQLLFDKAGVLIVKDSSANKCGVITSSFEICASMLLGEEEFLAIKDEVVQDVLRRLRELAGLEARLLFREYRNYPGALPHFSERISTSINRAYAAIRKKLADVQTGDSTYVQLLPLFVDEHLPRKLAEVAGDRVSDRIPLDYLRNAFGKILASKLLYSEGIHFLESQPEGRLAELAMRYIKEEKQVRELVSALDSCDMPDPKRRKVQELLRQGGTRSLLGVY